MYVVVNVAVATSVRLTFVSFWWAAAIVLHDLDSWAFYVGGIAEQAIGCAAPGVIRSPGQHTGKALGLGPAVRLYSDRPDFRGLGRPGHRGAFGPDAPTFGHPWHRAKETINLWAADIAVLITRYF